MVLRHELVTVAALAELGLVAIGLLRIGDRDALLLGEEQESMTDVIFSIELQVW